MLIIWLDFIFCYLFVYTSRPRSRLLNTSIYTDRVSTALRKCRLAKQNCSSWKEESWRVVWSVGSNPKECCEPYFCSIDLTSEWHIYIWYKWCFGSSMAEGWRMQPAAKNKPLIVLLPNTWDGWWCMNATEQSHCTDGQRFSLKWRVQCFLMMYEPSLLMG